MTERDKRYNEGFTATYVRRALEDWGSNIGWGEVQTHTDDLLKPATVEWTITLPDDTTRTFQLTVEEI